MIRTGTEYEQNLIYTPKFRFELNLHQGFSELTSNYFYCVKVQSIPSPADFELTRGMNLQAWHLQVGCCVIASALYEKTNC